MVGSVENSLVDSFLKDTLSIFDVFGFKIVDLNSDIDNFKIELQRNLEEVEDISLDINLFQLFLICLKLVSKILYPSLSENELTYNCINLATNCFEEKLSIEIDIISTKSGVFFLEAYCYDTDSLLIAKANSLLYLT